MVSSPHGFLDMTLDLSFGDHNGVPVVPQKDHRNRTLPQQDRRQGATKKSPKAVWYMYWYTLTYTHFLSNSINQKEGKNKTIFFLCSRNKSVIQCFTSERPWVLSLLPKKKQ